MAALSPVLPFSCATVWKLYVEGEPLRSILPREFVTPVARAAVNALRWHFTRLKMSRETCSPSILIG